MWICVYLWQFQFIFVFVSFCICILLYMFPPICSILSWIVSRCPVSPTANVLTHVSSARRVTMCQSTKSEKKSSFWQCIIKSHILKQQKWKWKNLGNINCHVPKCTKSKKNEIINFRIPNYEWVSQKNHLKYTFKATTIISCPHILFNDLFPLFLCSWATK